MCQNLRSLMNKTGTEASRLASIPCDNSACSRSFKTQGAWVNHALAEHARASELEATFAFNRARAAVPGSRPAAVAANDDAFTRDVNNAYNGLLAEGRLLERERNNGNSGRGEKRKRLRAVNKQVQAFENAREGEDSAGWGADT